jgi:hypothetical protein
MDDYTYLFIYIGVAIAYFWIGIIVAAICFRFSTITAAEKPVYRVIIGLAAIAWPVTLPAMLGFFIIYMVGFIGESIYNISQRILRVQTDEEEEPEESSEED